MNDLTLAQLEAVLSVELTDGWRTPANRTPREYHARQALHALRELQHRLAEYDCGCEQFPIRHCCDEESGCPRPAKR